MTMLDLDEATKQLRAHIQESMEQPHGVLASVFVPWAAAPFHVPLPGFSARQEPTQVQKVSEIFQLGFMLTTMPAGSPEIEYILFTSAMWMAKRPPGEGLRGTPSQQEDREEVLQVIHATPDGANRTWFWPIQREGGSASLGAQVDVPQGILTPLTAAFWAGVQVGKVQLEVHGKARPGQERG